SRTASCRSEQCSGRSCSRRTVSLSRVGAVRVSGAGGTRSELFMGPAYPSLSTARGCPQADPATWEPRRRCGRLGVVIDINLLRENPDLFRASQRARQSDVGLVDQILEADAQRRQSINEFESLRAEQKSFGKKVSQA